MTVEWRLRNVATGEFEDALVDVELTDAYNRFARRATATLDDPDGAVAAAYPRPTPVELEVKRDIDSGFSRRFGGFVSNPKTEAGTTTLELLSHDHWLRRREVYQGFSDATISTILADLITDLTPLVYDPDRVEVFDDQAITRDWKGERLDEVLAELASISGDEMFGATDDQHFYFEPSGSRTAPRSFDDGEWFRADFEEDGAVEVNEVTLYYGGDPATEAVVVEDRANQHDLQEAFGAPRPVVISTAKTFTEIGSEVAAERKATKLLADATAIRTGTVETWDAFDVRPGDLTRVVVPEQNVDGEYRVAQVTYRWADDVTELTLAENRQGVVDSLVALSDEVSRIDARSAASDATLTRFSEFDLPFEVALTMEVYERMVHEDALLWGENKAGWGDPRTGGGRWGDQRDPPEQLI